MGSRVEKKNLEDVQVERGAGIGTTELARDEIASLPAVAFFGKGSRTRLMAICAEPGMGRADVITEILARSVEEGFRTERKGFGGVAPETAAEQIVRIARRASRSSGKLVVAFDEIPGSDESCVRREARALRRMWEAGVPVVFSLAPEAEQLLEELPECAVITSADLLVSAVTALRRGDEQYRLKVLTRGIPSLVRSLQGSDLLSEEKPCPTYVEELSRLVATTLRPTLSDEELGLRLAMLLLGHGSRTDLEVVTGRPPDELLGSLRTHAPLYGISEHMDEFCCLHAETRTLLDAGHSQLVALGALLPEVAPACAQVLVDRGDYARAAAVCSLSESERALELVEEHGAWFLDAGEAALLRRALGGNAAAVSDGTFSVRSDGLRRALAALCSPTPPREALEQEEDFLFPASLGERDALLFVDARRVLQGRPLRSSFPENGWTALGKRLLVHREAVDLMRGGSWMAAQRLLLANPCPDGEVTVSWALLRVDAELARLMLCDVPGRDEASLARSCALLRSPAACGLSGCPALLDMARALLLGGSAGAGETDELVAKAERNGDTLVHAAALVAGCAFDLRRGASARANVRSVLAASVARRAGMGYLARVATMLGEVARFLLGEKLELGEEAPITDDLDRVRVVVHEALRFEEDALGSEAPDDPEVPREALWLLLVLCEGMGEFSSLLRTQIPRSWHPALAAAGENWPCEAAREEPDPLDEALGFSAPRRRAGAGARAGAAVRLCLLGGFTMSVDGLRVDDGELGHRNVMSMLEYLALQQGAAVRRYRVVEQVWPECDYSMGFNKIYQATSSLRATLERLGFEGELFVSSRASKTMALNTNLVSCDVDEFRACAKAATDSIDDARAVEMARRAEQLYKGDLYVPTMDATGFVAALRDSLRTLYADAMVVGADAALRLGRRRTAARLASNAMLADDQREDAVVTLVQALRASGRTAEAERHYRRYASRLERAGEGSSAQLLGHERGADVPALPEAGRAGCTAAVG